MSDTPELTQAVVDRRFQEIMWTEIVDPLDQVDSNQFQSDRSLAELETLSYQLSSSMQGYIAEYMTHGLTGDAMTDVMSVSEGLDGEVAEDRFEDLLGQIEEETGQEMAKGFSQKTIAKNLVTAAYIDGLDTIDNKADALQALLREFDELELKVNESDRKYIHEHFEKLAARASFNRFTYYERSGGLAGSPIFFDDKE